MIDGCWGDFVTYSHGLLNTFSDRQLPGFPPVSFQMMFLQEIEAQNEPLRRFIQNPAPSTTKRVRVDLQLLLDDLRGPCMLPTDTNASLYSLRPQGAVKSCHQRRTNERWSDCWYKTQLEDCHNKVLDNMIQGFAEFVWNGSNWIIESIEMIILHVRLQTRHLRPTDKIRGRGMVIFYFLLYLKQNRPS